MYCDGPCQWYVCLFWSVSHCTKSQGGGWAFEHYVLLCDWHQSKWVRTRKVKLFTFQSAIKFPSENIFSDPKKDKKWICMIMWPGFIMIAAPMFIYSVLLYVKSWTLGDRWWKPNHILVWVPVYVAPVQEDKNHIPFCVFWMPSENSMIIIFFPKFQWDLVGNLTSLHGFEVSLNRIHIFSAFYR